MERRAVFRLYGAPPITRLSSPQPRSGRPVKSPAEDPVGNRKSFLLKARNLFGANVESYGPRLAGRTHDESKASKRQDHLVNCRSRDLEVELEVGFCRWTPVNFRVCVEE